MHCGNQKENELSFLEMTIDEIMNGSSAKNFPGLVPLVQDYLRNIEVDTDTMCTLSRYLIYIQRKSQCQMMTNARFIRNFVQSVSGGITKFSKKLLTFAIFRNIFYIYNLHFHKIYLVLNLPPFY